MNTETSASALRKRWKLPVIILVAVVVAVVYGFFDPSHTWWMPKCPVYILTGYQCPGCGSQRALHALLHGDMAGAFRANAMLVVFIPVLAILWVSEARRGRWPGLFRVMFHPVTIIAVLVVLVAWGIGRNLWL